ncbi:universal stress protein [Mariniflexile aquimaris]|uniref:Universal stress protein n=1 Tax=Mariniflexile aquimaris TaxID=881009 RepID=A0ABW3BT30_9FLAO
MKTNNLNILLPTDFSDNAWNAAVYALKLYEEFKCTFYFLHSTKIAAMPTTVRSSKLSDTVNSAAKKELLELKELANVSNPNLNHSYEIIVSPVGIKDAIETTIKKHNINLVVMGTKGATGAKELLFGSNTVSIIKKMRLAPILVVPEDYDFVVPRQIAFPTDFNRVYTHIEINALINLAIIHGSKIRIVHVNKEKKLSTVQEQNKATLNDSLKEYDHTFHWMPDYTKIANAIYDYVEELDIDILAMVNYKHSIIEDLVHEPVISKIGYHLKIPFLVIPV